MINLPPIFILVGGLGSRIRSEIGETAKALSLIDKKVFLDLQVKVDPDWVQDASLIAEYASLDIV